jgi:23S rRNA (pseudouridine1915-N3)-methyltransferase
MKSMSVLAQREAEGKVILSAIEKVDYPVLLDIGGKQFSSEGFAKYMQQCMNKGIRHLGFIIGGPFGFSDEVYNTVPEKISVSAMTFSHQLIRLIFIEQLYRSFTILKGEPYHHA